ncbi:MAG: histone deacetylase [archaeon]
MKIVFSQKSLEYRNTLGNPQRLIQAHNFLRQHYKFISPKQHLQQPTVHSKELIEKVKTNTYSDPDVPNRKQAFEYAMLSINGAIKAQEQQAFALIDPPGHHASKNKLGGFCYFNNICQAIEQSKLKTLILDIDGHHGNGTEEIVRRNKEIFYISLHKSPCYPGTGYESYDNILNIPLQRCGEEIYLSALSKAIRQIPKPFNFQQIAISAGFDTYQSDLASLGLEKSSYGKIAKIIKNLQEKNNSRIFAVWEGGYSQNIGELIHEFVEEL